MPITTSWSTWWNDVCAGLDSGAAPGGAAWVAVDGEVVLHAAHGLAQAQPSAVPLDVEMWFDLASVSKAIGTTSCVMALVDDGRLDLDAPVAEHLPELGAAGEGMLTARHLLTHQAGLPAWVKFYLTCDDRDEVRSAVLSTPLEAPPGERCVYSDVGFLTLGFLCEAITGRRQDELFRERILERYGLAELGYRPGDPARCVATEYDGERGGMVRGQVHDENAWACSGVAGHAGLFGTVAGAGRFGQALLDGALFSDAARQAMFTPRDDVAGERFWLGWKRLQYESGDAAAFAHDGFTGTLLWVSPRYRMVVALLTNRVHPTRENRRIYELRPGWIEAAWRIVDQA